MEKQRTIKKEISFRGVGLHTGKEVQTKFLPAEADSGITFIRADLANRPAVKASLDELKSTSGSPRRTSIGSDELTIHTVEHLLAALSGMGIDNMAVELNGTELPGLDGSSLEYVKLLQDAGSQELEAARTCVTIRDSIVVEEHGASLVVMPWPELKISYTLDYNHPLLKSQFFEITVNSQSFQKELAGARTFCLEEEAAYLQSQGLGLGANYNNTLVVGKEGVIKNKVRFPDEFVRHKILDLLGDLYLLGRPVKGHIIAIKSGHFLNLKLIKRIVEQLKTAAQKISPVKISDSDSMDVEMIKRVLPHREPFLFVDRITHLEKGKRATGVKNVTINDYWFRGHFPGRPVMPGVIIVEAMAQVGGVMMLSLPDNHGKLAFFMSLDKVKFRKTVVPGDQLVLEAEVIKMKSRTGIVQGKAYVDGKLVAEAELMFILIEGEE